MKAQKETNKKLDIDELIAQTYIKPIESEKRVFALVNTASMNGPAQNKLLKTLEEPPKNVFILMGIENESAILPTVKSRIKKPASIINNPCPKIVAKR